MYSSSSASIHPSIPSFHPLLLFNIIYYNLLLFPIIFGHHFEHQKKHTPRTSFPPIKWGFSLAPLSQRSALRPPPRTLRDDPCLTRPHTWTGSAVPDSPVPVSASVSPSINVFDSSSLGFAVLTTTTSPDNNILKPTRTQAIPTRNEGKRAFSASLRKIQLAFVDGYSGKKKKNPVRPPLFAHLSRQSTRSLSACQTTNRDASLSPPTSSCCAPANRTSPSGHE